MMLFCAVREDREHISHKVFSICLAELQTYKKLEGSTKLRGIVVSRWGGQFSVGGYDESWEAQKGKKASQSGRPFEEFGLGTIQAPFNEFA